MSQERSRQRRQALLEAAIRVFGEGGIRAVTHRAVAAEAGLPLAATTYYFASIDELVRESLRYHVASFIQSFEQLPDVSMDGAGLLDLDVGTQIVEAVFAIRDLDSSALELSVYLHAARDPELRDVAFAGLHALSSFITETLKSAGVRGDTEELVSLVTAQVVGAAMRRQSRPDDQAEARRLARAIRNLVAAHVLGDEAVTRVFSDISGRSAESP
ncbi:TetR/AcrR family transcriptional regulator [Aeromicrobium phragmitis]|uniref:TetR/AcrR family transcriptional regulator n=1 Tax=Aeromicrobium phragmitis TaxID=2478914 RepID=UPI001AA06751|nr:TetR family transcriptional regulator [Aeromicrobium phragmitis]